MALKSRSPRQEYGRIGPLPPQMTQHLPPTPQKPVRYLFVALVLSLTLALAGTMAWILAGLPLTLWGTVLRCSLVFVVTVRFMVWQDRRWRRRNPPPDPQESVRIMALRYIAANAKSAPWN